MSSGRGFDARGEIVQEYSARIIAWEGDNYDGGSTVGNAEFYIVKVAAAMNGGISLMDAIDSVNQDVYEYGAAVLDLDTGDIRADLAERFEYISGDLMFLHVMKILPLTAGETSDSSRQAA
ncbi:MAG TPA: hypothetical protein VF516_29740 [Kofleriaceae bacterium]